MSERDWINHGLDLSTLGSATAAEKTAFNESYVDYQGRPHPGLQFYLENNPQAMKLYRAFAEVGHLSDFADLQSDVRVGFGFLAYYAITGYTEGVRYTVHIRQQVGMTRAQIMEGLAIVFLQVGPRGAETIAQALADYPWIEPSAPAVFPAGWAADPKAFESGLDFSSDELSAAEIGMLERWYARYLGEVPRHVRFAAKHTPRVLKAGRHRFETCVRELPKQAVPATLLHYDVLRGYGPGIRENVLLARGFGMSKSETLRVIANTLIIGGSEMLSLVDEVAGPIFEQWDVRP